MRLLVKKLKYYTMKHGSLFSGIGGFDYAAQLMEWNNVFQCENNWFSRKILNYYWPKTILYEDIKQTDFSIHRREIDILTGGFPCQPYSTAGKRRGTEDDRDLWPEMFRVVQQVEPLFIVAENVPGIVNWSGGMVFNEIISDLEGEGYEVQPLLLPASGVNAPHKRERLWIVAYDNNRNRQEIGLQTRWKKYMDWNKKNRNITNTSQFRHEQSRYPREGVPRFKDSSYYASNPTNTGFKNMRQQRDNWPTQPPICSGDDGVSIGLDGITFSRWRNESIKAYGNAIVPQVAIQIFEAIESSLT